MRSCVTSTQSLMPIAVPTADLISLKSLNIRMSVTCSDLHFRALVGNDPFGFRYRHHLADADAGRGLQQGAIAVGEPDDGHVDPDPDDRSPRGQGQGALADALRFALR